VTELGIVRNVRDDMKEKALLPIVVTEFGIVRDFRDVMLEKA